MDGKYARSAGIFCTFMAASVGLHAQTPMGTGFNYQGRLTDGGSPANGDYDFTFTLCQDQAGTNQIAGPIVIQDQQVINGLFTVKLDFGVGIFTGDARWLRIGVRPGASTDVYTDLSPPQELTPAPYALYALNGASSGGFWTANGDDIYNTNVGKVGIGTSTPAEVLHVAGAAPGLHLQDNGDPTGYTVIRDDSSLATTQVEKRAGPGDVPTVEISPIPVDGISDARIRLFRRTDTIGSKVVIFNRGDDSSAVSALIGVDGYDSWFQADGGYFGIGTSSPAYPLHLAGTANIMAKIATSNTAGTWLDLQNTSAGGKRWGVVSTGSANGEGPGHLLLRNITDGRTVMTLKGTGDVGIGTTAPQAKLHVEGETRLTGVTRIGTGGTADATAKLNILGGTETGPSGGGYLVVGPADSTNVSFDDNEIQARNSGITAPLAINPAGGGVRLIESGSGEVGVGTTNPLAKLDVVAPADQAAIHGSGGNFGMAGWGTLAGGYFKDPDGTAEAWLGADEIPDHGGFDTGVYARADYRGGVIENTLYGTHVWLAYATESTEGNGSKDFVQNHPYDKDKVIHYSCLEGDEVGTYTRGSGRLIDGEARIALGETFKWVTNPDIGLTAQLTPRDQAVPLAVVSLTTEELVVRGPEGGRADVAFDYVVNGLRIGFEESSVVRDKQMEAYIPSMAGNHETYAKHPDLRELNPLERFKTMRASRGMTASLDLSRAHALRDAITVYDPAVHKMPHPPRPERTPVAAAEPAPASASSAVADSTQTGTVQSTHDKDAEIQELRARIDSLEKTVAQLVANRSSGQR